MPKYLVTSGAQFTPFTYEQMAKPIMQLQEAHNAAQDAYDELTMNTDALDQYIRNGDTEARRLYDNYREKLDALQSNLWNYGYTAQTRRDLQAARRGFADDINRISKAVEARQNASNKYWDARHNNPNLVTGEDPGVASLNNYMRDDTYGQNWFSYDTAQFEKEVGTEVQNRAREILNGLTDANGVVRNTALAGTLTRVLKQGVTNEETVQASTVVDDVLNMNAADRQAYYTANNIDDAVQLLTETLLNKYDSTGIRNSDVSAEGRARLLNSGKSGFSYGVMAPEIKDFDDPEYAYQRQMRLYKDQLKANKEANKDDNKPNTYEFSRATQDISNDRFADVQEDAAKKYKPYENGKTYTITLEDGSVQTVDSPWAMADYIFNSDVRERIRQSFGGLDVALPAQGGGVLGTGMLVNNNTRQYGTAIAQNPSTGEIVHIPVYTGNISKIDASKYGFSKDDVGVYNSDGNLNTGATTAFNNGRREYESHVQKMKELNPSIDFDSLAITPEQQKEYRKKYLQEDDPQSLLSSRDLYSAITASAMTGSYPVATIVGTEQAFNDLRTNLGNRLFDSVHSAASTEKTGKDSKYTFYPVSEDGITETEKGTTDLLTVFGEAAGTDKSKNVNSDNISSITVSPIDLARAANTGRLLFTMTTATGPTGKWKADISLLGPEIQNALMGSNSVVGSDGRTYAGASVAQQAADMMLPITNAGAVLNMTDQQAAEYSQRLFDTLYIPNATKQNSLPTVMDAATGQQRPATAKEIARNPVLRKKLYNSVAAWLDNIISVTRDEMTVKRRQTLSTTSQDPNTLIPQ